MNRILVSAAAALACVLGSNAAQAALVTVAENGSIIASWQQGSTPVPTDYTDGYYTRVTVYNPTGSVVGPVAWYNLSHSGGLTDYSGALDISGPQVYTGPESAPVFGPGVWTGVDAANGLIATITISVPEPATWAMMLAGMGMIGLAVRRRGLGTGAVA